MRTYKRMATPSHLPVRTESRQQLLQRHTLPYYHVPRFHLSPLRSVLIGRWTIPFPRFYIWVVLSQKLAPLLWTFWSSTN